MNLCCRYSISQIDPGVVFEDSKYGRGWKNIVYNKVNFTCNLPMVTSTYSLFQEVELVIGPLALIAARQVYLDFSYPDYIAYYEFLIPAPELSNNFGAPWKPYSRDVMINKRKILLNALQFLELHRRGFYWF